MKLAKLSNKQLPREKLLAAGAQSLSNSELLAIFLRVGIPGKNVVTLSEEILHHFGGLKQLFSADFESFCALKGLGQAKFVQLQACLEMSHRYLTEAIAHGDVIENPTHVKSYAQSQLAHRYNEVFAAFFLDNQNRVLAFEELFFGTVNAASVHPRIVVQRALLLNAVAIIVVHNHPSGVAEASLSDIEITKTLTHALALIDVRLLDHLIVAQHQVISMAEHGQLAKT